MKHLLVAASVAAAILIHPVFAANVGVSVIVGDPGFYGQIDIGGYPSPVVIYPEPIIIERGPVYGPPVYLRVPPGYAKHWRRHCREYNACGEPVYFIRDEWYEREYVPRYRERHHHDEDDDED